LSLQNAATHGWKMDSPMHRITASSGWSESSVSSHGYPAYPLDILPALKDGDSYSVQTEA
jgi:hypothetical protein